MKYCVLIIDGAADWPLPQREGKTCLELARTPHLDAMAAAGVVGLARTVPDGVEASSANACMSVLGYDPRAYRLGRAAIEARSLGIPINEGEVLFRCNLVTVEDGLMRDYSAGRIGTDEARQLIKAVNKELGSGEIEFFPGLNYRHILKIKNDTDVLKADCTPPHDISGRPIAEYLPKGPGSQRLLDLMKRSEAVLAGHPVNLARRERGELPATTIWLFWGSPKEPQMPSFSSLYGPRVAVTSAVDVINGLAGILGMDVLQVPGVTDGMDNDFAAQADAALSALDDYDMAVIHVEAPDEAGHGGDIDEKVEAIEVIDRDIVGRLQARGEKDFRVLVMPDHPTPIEIRTHCPDPVPFLLWGGGLAANGASGYDEKQAAGTGLSVDPGYLIMNHLVKDES